MRATFLISMVFIYLGSYGQDTKQTSQIDQLLWLCKTWERTNIKQGQKTFEKWTRKGNVLEGVGVTIQGQDTVFIERLSISERDGELHYGSEVAHNPAPVYFKVQITGETSFISRNTKHDFPKAIEYNLEGEYLTAIISGDGKQVPFRFKVMK